MNNYYYFKNYKKKIYLNKIVNLLYIIKYIKILYYFENLKYKL